MVEIRRPTKQRASSSFWSCRNVILLAVLLQLLSMIVSLLRSTSNSSQPTIQKKPKSENNAKGMQGALDSWKDSQRKGGLGRTGNAGKLQKATIIPKQKPVQQEEEEAPAEENPDENNNNPDEPAPDQEDANPDEAGANVNQKEGESTKGHDKRQREGQQEEENNGADVDADEENHKAVGGHDDAAAGKPDASAVIDPAGGISGKRGSGPTPLGYLADYQHERENPAFRNGKFPEEFSAMERIVAKQLNNKHVIKACQYVENRKLLTQAKCREADATLWVYNSAPFARTWCGVEVDPRSVKRIEEPCTEPVRILPADVVPVDGVDMPSIIIAAHRDGANDPEFVPCDIPCQVESNMQGTTRNIVGTDWKITQTWDDPFSNPEARVERTAYREEQYYSTTSFKSSVPLSFYSFDKYNLRNTKAVDYDAAENKATYLIDKDCHSPGSRRHKWFHSMQANFPVAALGACHHDTELKSGDSLATPEDRLKVLRQYRFNMAFDFMTEKDHIPPFIWESLVSGTVPILLGAQNMRDHLPAKSFIFAGDYSMWDLMSKYVVNVAANKTLWESYHAWRTDKKVLDEFEVKYNFTKTSPNCRMCRWAYARRYGLGWDHAQQVVKENRLTRKLCADSNTGLAFSPFHESWLSGTDHNKVLRPAALSTCPELTNVEHTIEVSDEVKVHRTVIQHDGITDISVHNIESSTEGDVSMQLEFDVRNSEGAYFPNTHRLVATERGPLVTSISIQDEYSKVTVLANWETRITSPMEGVIEILVQEDRESPHPDQERRIRVITEDLSTLHDKMTEFFPSPFSKMMMKDFVDPLETFYVET